VKDLLVPGGGVNEPLIEWCRIQHGRPASRSSAPTLRDDGRFRAIRQLRGQSGTGAKP
jgi:hypothetical protein